MFIIRTGYYFEHGCSEVYTGERYIYEREPYAVCVDFDKKNEKRFKIYKNKKTAENAAKKLTNSVANVARVEVVPFENEVTE